MPNWCENKISIWSENKEDMDKFKKKAFKINKDGDKVFKFNNLIPMPKGLDIAGGYRGEGTPEQEELEKLQSLNIKKHGYKDWYDWSNYHWGTKWDVEDVMISSEDDDLIEMDFETAWCPPEPVFQYIRTNFPDLTISWFFHEPGMELTGYLE